MSAVIVNVTAKERRDGLLTTYTVTTDDGRTQWHDYPHNIGNDEAEPARRWLADRKAEQREAHLAAVKLRALQARAAWRRKNQTAPLYNGATDADIFAHEVAA